MTASKASVLQVALPGFARLSPGERDRVMRLVDVVDVPAGTLAGRAGVAGRWRSVVLQGQVATTRPPRTYGSLEVLEHGPETALLAVTDLVLATVDARTGLLLTPGSRPSRTPHPLASFFLSLTRGRGQGRPGRTGPAAVSGAREPWPSAADDGPPSHAGRPGAARA